MNLPSFKEFKKSLTQKDKDYIIGLTEDDTPTFSGTLANPEDVKKFTGFISGVNFGINLRLLEVYHEWLSEQLQQPHDH